MWLQVNFSLRGEGGETRRKKRRGSGRATRRRESECWLGKKDIGKQGRERGWAKDEGRKDEGNRRRGRDEGRKGGRGMSEGRTPNPRRGRGEGCKGGQGMR